MSDVTGWSTKIIEELRFASKAGAETHPDWSHNLVAYHAVTVEAGTETYRATVEPLADPQRHDVYEEQARRFPGFADYQQKTARPIPVVELRRAG